MGEPIYVTIVGSGKVASVLATTIASLKGGEFVLRQIVARNEARGRFLAKSVHSVWCESYSQMQPSNIYLIAVSDRAIGPVSSQMACFVALGAIVAHTSGAMPIDVIASEIGQRGVFYPLVSFYCLDKPLAANVPILVECMGSKTTSASYNILYKLARSISENVQEVSSKDREALHVAAVFANNFSNLMQIIASDITVRSGLKYDLLKPLVLSAAESLSKSDASPINMQTGPAVRGDVSTIERHREYLKYDIKLQQLYDLLTQTIIERVKNG